MIVISQTIFSDIFSWMKRFVFWLKLHLSLYLRVQLTSIGSANGFALNRRQVIIWTNVDHYLNQCWLHRRIYDARGWGWGGVGGGGGGGGGGRGVDEEQYYYKKHDRSVLAVYIVCSNIIFANHYVERSFTSWNTSFSFTLSTISSPDPRD